MDIIVISLSIVSLITTGLSLFIIRGEYNDQNKTFSLFILSIGLWSFGLMLFRITNSLDLSLDITRFYYISAACIPLFFLRFSNVFPSQAKPSKIKRFLVYLPSIIITVGLILVPNLIISDVFFSKTGVKLAHVNTVNYYIYTIYFITYLLIAYKNLFRSFRITSDKSVKIQLKFIFIGTIIPYMFAMFFDLILPPFDYSLVWVGPLFAFAVVLVIMYAVYKHNLLNAKVITTEILTASLWIFILIRSLLSETDQDRIVNLVMLLLTVIIGILLIRNLRKEISQREKIEKLAIDLRKANTRLLELDKQKSEFVSFATHQLRAPLTAMKGYSSLILEGEMGTLNEQVRMAVSRIFDSSNTLTTIVNDYLNISRIELGTMKYSFEILDFKKLTENVIAELQPNIDKSGLKFNFSTNPSGADDRFMIHADPDKFKQVIVNLIDNSMKYTPTGSIEVHLSKNTITRKITFSIKDTGVGISPEVMPKLFVKFVRAENATRQNIYGTGLGLFVAKDMVMSHKGKLWAESDGEGKGSTFFVEMDMEV